jgi:hypothetical protein
MENFTNKKWKLLSRKLYNHSKASARGDTPDSNREVIRTSHTLLILSIMDRKTSSSRTQLPTYRYL